MLQKVDINLKFENKRNRKLITPCCSKKNSDGKFVTYKGFPDNYGYCHSCGISNLPPPTYVNGKGEKFMWNDTTKQFENSVIQLSHENVLPNRNTNSYLYDSGTNKQENTLKYIDFHIVKKFYESSKENNLLIYLRNTYGNESVNRVKKMYYLGSNKDQWVVFWMISKEGMVQKAKVVRYNENGKRTNNFKVPFKNTDGYYSCLFGEHLLKDNNKPIILVESEKTALVAAIVFPKYSWLAYGGINGLTDTKLKALSGESVIIIPDMSEKAVSIMKNKRTKFEKFKVDVRIFDMREGISDEELKKLGWYNCDVEDILKKPYLS